MGVGTGVQVGMFYTDNSIGGMGPAGKTRIQGPESVAYCIKGTQAIWEYYPDEMQQSKNEQTSPVSIASGLT